tara:strand:- start:1121 stop:1252 length:132 start_codon:yes stop_codon:yes gene_type:complete
MPKKKSKTIEDYERENRECDTIGVAIGVILIGIGIFILWGSQL